jgi:hypothetical protein
MQWATVKTVVVALRTRRAVHNGKNSGSGIAELRTSDSALQKNSGKALAHYQIFESAYVHAYLHENVVT